MLRSLETALSEKRPSASVVAAGLRQALLAVYGSQLGLVVLTALGVWLIGPPPPRNLGWSWWLLAMSGVMYGSIAFFAEREFGRAPSLKSGLQLAILLGVSSALPAIFGLLVIVLEGLGLGAWVLLFASSQALLLAVLRLTVVAYRIPRVQDEESSSASGESVSA